MRTFQTGGRIITRRNPATRSTSSGRKIARDTVADERPKWRYLLRTLLGEMRC